MSKSRFEEIKELYNLFGFNVYESTNEYIIFQQNRGYFNNVEIVIMSKTFDAASLKSELSEAGFAVKVKLFETIEKLHEDLFLGFFCINCAKEREKSNYNQFCEMQTKKKITGEEYKYIECNFTLNNENVSMELIQFIIDQIEKEKSGLLIIEAAAGYGKTCTSYEITHALSSHFDHKIPLLTELSKNRKASIFRYVLLSEIDANFTGLKYELVEKEILDGNIPLIIDGFDELLSKSIELQNDNKSDQFKESQTMLDTIAQFFTNDSKAKIIITSRKSSIFTGELFENWIVKRGLNCDINRIQLGTPNCAKWLGLDKYNILKKNKPELIKISNPILLDIVRSMGIDELNRLTVSDIIEVYYDKLLEREIERQSLLIDKNEQMNIMRQLAVEFVELDITSEEYKCIAEMFEMILGSKLDEYISKYNDLAILNEGTVPDREEFISKLSHHAFLDRVSVSKNNIGFINYFVFGLLIGDALVSNQLSIEKVSFRFIDIAATAYTTHNKDKREALFKVIEPSLDRFEENNRIYIDSKLLFHPSKSYSECVFTSIHFESQFEFFKEYKFINCSFYDCSFENCKISLQAFIECQFMNCKFFDSILVDDTEIDNQLIFVSCLGEKEFNERASQYIPPKVDGRNYKKILLEQFWKPGKDLAERRCGFHTVYRGISKNDIKYIDDALKELISQGVIKKLSMCYELNFSKIDEISRILERT